MDNSLSAALQAEINSLEDGCGSDVWSLVWCLAAVLASEHAAAALPKAASANNLLFALGSLPLICMPAGPLQAEGKPCPLNHALRCLLISAVSPYLDHSVGLTTA